MSVLAAHDTNPAVYAFRQEVREWLGKNWHGDRQAAHLRRAYKDQGRDAEFSRLLGMQGWIGLGWPKEAGGGGRSPYEQLAFIEEMQYAEAPIGFHSTAETIVGPALIKYGSSEQKEEYLTLIRRGERSFALHYSEPEAGSDLASLRTSAKRDGDDWIINGQKLWSTGGDVAEYSWLAVRTDPDAKPRHAGISVFLMPLKTKGIAIRPSMAMYGKTFSATFYDDVRIPARNLVGEVNGGWKVITDALASERVTIGSRMATLQHVFNQLVAYIRTAEVGGRALRNDLVLRDRLGGLAAELEVARQFALRNVRVVEEGRSPLYEAAMSKVFAGELQERLSEATLDLLGSGALLSKDAPSAPLGQLEQMLRHSLMGTIGGGTPEMQRNAIALRGLQMPRPTR